MPETVNGPMSARDGCWQWLEVEQFRGFRRRAHFSLGASALIVHGPNGTGKTSFFDAIQWLLLGDLPRLRTLRMRQTEEYIRNAYSNEPARVSSEFLVRGQVIRASRTGDRSGSDLSLQIDNERIDSAAAQGALEKLLATGMGNSLRDSLFNSALLQQDDLRYVLTASPGDRFEQMSRLLGLGSLERFEADAVKAAKAAEGTMRLARKSGEDTQARVAALRVDISVAEEEERALPATDTLLNGLAADIGHLTGVGLEVDVPTSLGQVSGLSKAARLLEGRLRSLFESCRDLEQMQGGLPEQAQDVLLAERDRRAARHAEAEEELSGQSAALGSLQRVLAAAQRDSDQLAQLIALAMPLLNERCPICEQEIDPDAVRRSLDARASQAGALSVVQNEIAVAQAARDVAAAAVVVAAESLTTADRQLGVWSEWTLRRHSADGEWRQLVSTDGPLRLASRLDDDGHVLDIRQVLSSLETVSTIRRSVDATSSALAVLARGSRLSGLGEELEVAEQRAAAMKEASESAARGTAAAEALAKAATRARLQVIRRRITALQPLVDDIYSRLEPHPTFQRFQFDSDVFRNKGTMSPLAEDEAAGVAVSPSLAFSSAQANMTALTYFLALAWATGKRAMPFICLDDPLQDMDDVNVLAFTDLARHLREDRQLILTTHERRFAALLRRKLAPRTDNERLRLITFTGWSRDGPEYWEDLVDYVPTTDLRLLAG